MYSLISYEEIIILYPDIVSFLQYTTKGFCHFFPQHDEVKHSINTHVQYTQTDTIRQTDGPLVPMVGLVPIEKDVIPMVLLVNMHLIKGTLIVFPCDLAGYRAIPMVYWYQWYDWYQWKSTLFQWFYW